MGEEVGSLLAMLRALPPVDRGPRILNALLAETGRLLGGFEIEEVDPDEGFLDAGLDSLRLIELREWLESAFELDVETTLAFDQPTPRKLAEHLLQLLFPPAVEDVQEAAGDTDALEDLDAAALRSLLRSERAAREAERHEPIAVIGYSCRLPGGAKDPDAFWDLLAGEGDGIVRVPEDRWSHATYHRDEPGVPGTSHVDRGGFLEDVAGFDARFFNLSPREAEELDPQQRLLLEVAWEALEDAGVDAARTKDEPWGVFVGTRASEYFDSQATERAHEVGPFYATGNAISTAAGRLSYFLGWTGPCFALDTACSGSLVAVHQAMRALREGSCAAALAGGVNLIIDPASHVALTRARMLAPDGRCKTFDAAADGYARAEGAGFVLLKRLSDAQADGDRIDALLLGSAINQDGASGGLTVPSGEAQERVIEAALDDAGLAPSAIDHVEAHGTGTSLGDPIEIAALDRVFGATHDASRPLLISSVKTVIGHAEAAAGISGLLKVLLALRHECLPAHRNLETPSPHVPWDERCVSVVTRRTPWKPRAVRPRIAGVSSFGFSGTNAHVIVGEAPRELVPPTEAAEPTRRPRLLPLSASSPTALRELVARVRERVPTMAEAELGAIERTLCAGRTPLGERAAVVLGEDEGLSVWLDRLASVPAESATHARVGPIARGRAGVHAPRVAFAFTGQGSQRPGMGRGLAGCFPVFSDVIDQLDAVARESGLDLKALLFEADASTLAQTRNTQPAILAYELAFAALLRSFGVTPAVALGHSIGEIAAVADAGALSAEDALRLVIARGRLMDELTPPGAMLAVRATAEEVRSELTADASLAIAAFNAGALVTVAGSVEAIASLERRLKQRGIAASALSVSRAFHSPLMEPMLDAFAAELDGLEFEAGQHAVVSALEPVEAETSVARWVRHVREPVRFTAALDGLAQSEATAVIELGPQAHLAPLARRHDGLHDHAWLAPRCSADMTDAEEVRAFLELLGALFVRGVPVRTDRMPGLDATLPARLPTHPFQRERFWLRPADPGVVSGGVHPFEGREIVLPDDEDSVRRREVAVGATHPTWLADHAVFGRPLLPLAGWIELAARTVAPPEGVVLEGVTVRAPCFLGDEPLRLHVQAEAAGGRIVVSGETAELAGDQRWTTHLLARWSHLSADDGASAATLPDAHDIAPKPQAFYEDLAARGLEYGPAFQTVTGLELSGDEGARVTLALPQVAGEAAGMLAHPALLDGAFQAAAAFLATEDGPAWLPLGVDRVVLRRPLGARATASVHRVTHRESERSRVLDLVLVGEDGELAARIEGLALVPAEARDLLGNDPRVLRCLHHVRWNRRAPVEDAASSEPALLGLGALPEGMEDPVAGPRLVDPVAEADALRSWLEVHAGSGVLVLGPRPDAELSRALEDLAALVRAWPEGLASTRLLACSIGAEAVDAVGERPLPSASGLRAALASLVLEGAPFEVRHVDCDLRATTDELARIVRAEALADDAERRVAWRAGARHLARWARGAGDAGLLAPQDGDWTVRTPEYGVIERLAPRPIAIGDPGPGEVRLRMRSAGLNFKDVLHALGMLASFAVARGIEEAREQPFGMEGLGVVEAVGDGVTRCAVGDEVLAIAEGTLGSRVLTEETAVVALHGQLRSRALAGLPVVYLTALHALEDLAALQAGESVLIHAAAGGVGQAAIAVARRRGARIFATASRGKHAFLAGQGLAAVFDSRTVAFADAIRAATDGRGVDVVLDAVGGAVLDASLQVLAPGGRCVEIGKLDVPAADEIRERRPDIGWWQFDLADVFDADPACRRDLLDRLAAGLADGSLTELPTTVVSLRELHAGFDLLARSRAIGKVVCDLRPPPVGLGVASEGAWLITGGLGALGMGLAARLVERGVRRLVLMGRRPPDEVIGRQIATLRESGTEIEVVSGGVTDERLLAALFRRLAEDDTPLRGVIHAAGVLEDGLLAGSDPDARARVLEPKVTGTAVLDRLTREQDLDLEAFVVLSSLSAVLGVAGQTAYAAANAAMEAIVTRRRAEGLAGLAVQLGPVAEGGMAARMDARDRERITSSGIRFLDLGDICETIDAALAAGRAVTAVADLDLARLASAPGRGDDPLFEDLRTRERGGTSAAPTREDAVAAMRDLDPGARRDWLVDLLDGELARGLGYGESTGLEEDASFESLGIDSLAAVDMKTRLEESLGQALPATLFFDHPSLGLLADHLLALVLPSEEEADGDASGASGDDDLPSDTGEGGDDEDLEARLAAQIARMKARRARGGGGDGAGS